MSDTLTYDLIVIGCGPAGMAAAIKASNAGLLVVMLDDQPDQGGQV
ncbi:MAG: NAD(P)/FAD-dependent oxidoreductase, partial [Alphaproteobacteria bacterium]|nr:NAD(P)/FAD-dependent oxidoreductase [Alphaproteobacteria bacterium]